MPWDQQWEKNRSFSSSVGGEKGREREMVFEGRKSVLKISLSLPLSLFAGRHQTNTPAPQTNPPSTAPTLTASVHSHTPIPHYTQAHTKHINARIRTRKHTHTQSHSSLHTRRTEQWEIAESERERCFGVMGGNVGVSSGIDEVLFQRLSPEQGRCALAV